MFKVSVIVPVYNTEKYLSKCLDSVLGQSYKNIEIIAVNDGSTDGSLKILEDYSKKSSNIIVINKKNNGVSAARNDGLKRATGEYMMFVDSDDWIDCNMIAEMMVQIKEENADIVKCGYVRDSIVKQDYFKLTNEKKIYKKENKISLYNEIINNYKFNSACTQLFSKKLITDGMKFDSNVKIGEDLLFNLDLYTNAETVVALEECYYHYYYNDNSATTKLNLSNVITRCNDAIFVYYCFFDYLKKWNLDETYYKKICYRVLKELNVKLVTLYRIKNMPSSERKKIVKKYMNNEKIRECSENLTFLYIIKNKNINDLFIYFITRKNYFMYNFLSKAAAFLKK